MKVSFLVTYYNQAKYVRQSLQSIIDLNMRWEYEILVGDDGSDDNTVNEVNKFKIDNPTVCIFCYIMERNHNEKQDSIARASACRKYLLKKATGDLYCILDGDDFYIDKDFIADAVRVFENKKNRRVSVVGFNYAMFSGTRFEKRRMEHLPGIVKKETYLENYYVHAGACVHKRQRGNKYIERIEKIWSFDDNDIVYNSLYYGDMFYIDKCIYAYRQTRNSTWNSMNRLEKELCNAIGFDTSLMYLPMLKRELTIRNSNAILYVFIRKNKISKILDRNKLLQFKKQSAATPHSYMDVFLNGGSFREKVKCAVLALQCMLYIFIRWIKVKWKISNLVSRKDG